MTVQIESIQYSYGVNVATPDKKFILHLSDGTHLDISVPSTFEQGEDYGILAARLDELEASGAGSGGTVDVSGLLLKSSNLGDVPNKPTALTNLGFSALGKQLIAVANQAALQALVGTDATLAARVAAIEAVGSLASDAELIAAVAGILGSADSAGDTLGELQALIGARLLKTNNLGDLPNASTALSNLGFSTYFKTLIPIANQAALQAAVGTDPALSARVAAIEAMGSLATDAELIAAVTQLIGTADTAGDTLGELQALISGRLLAANNLADLQSVQTALTNLGFSAFSKTLLPLADNAALRALVRTGDPRDDFPIYAINNGGTGSVALPSSGSAEIAGCLISVPITDQDVWLDGQMVFKQTTVGVGFVSLYVYEGSTIICSWVAPLPNSIAANAQYGQVGGKFNLGPQTAKRRLVLKGASPFAASAFMSATNPAYLGACLL